MPKKLIVCCDGTWNEPESMDPAEHVPTNVLKTFRAISPYNEQESVHQIVYYSSGVGTGNKTDRLVGGAFGKGVRKNIHSAYRFIASNYLPGDEIYCFGFSRGAYTVRSLCGLLNTIGLLPKQELWRLPAAFNYYRTEPGKRRKVADPWLNGHLRAIQLGTAAPPPVKFLGVWDTVGSMGAPTPVIGRFTRGWIGFHDTRLSTNVQHAYHALAVDEQRGPFKPDLWTSTGKANEVMQVWFAGVHSNVGGGYLNNRLSDIAWTWMMTKAQSLGLSFLEKVREQDLDPQSYLDPTEDSYSAAYNVLSALGAKRCIRSLDGPVYGKQGDLAPVNVMLHESLVIRREKDAYYRPPNLDEKTLETLPTYPIGLQERRDKHRIQLGNCPGLLRTEGKAYRCEIIDFAKAKGMRVQAQESLPPATRVVIENEITGHVEGEIVWQKENELGLRALP